MHRIRIPLASTRHGRRGRRAVRRDERHRGRRDRRDRSSSAGPTRASKTSTLTSRAGAPLSLHAPPGRPPMRVDSARQVSLLNADLLDGLHGRAFARQLCHNGPAGLRPGPDRLHPHTHRHRAANQRRLPGPRQGPALRWARVLPLRFRRRWWLPAAASPRRRTRGWPVTGTTAGATRAHHGRCGSSPPAAVRPFPEVRRTRSAWGEGGGRYWTRTSDLTRVKRAL